MSRKEIYAYIKANGLQKEVENTLHQNFTRCTTAALEDFVNAHKQPKVEPIEAEPVKEESHKINLSKEDSKQGEEQQPVVSTALEIAFVKLVDCLTKRHILLSTEVYDILNSL